MAHIHEKIDFTVDVFVVHKGRVLLRMHDKYKIWLAPGGHIELNEDPTQAAIREVKEEVGLDVELWKGNEIPVAHDERVKILTLPVSMNRHFVSDTHEHISLVYFAATTHDGVIVGDHDDASHEWKWFTQEELDQTDMPQNIREYAKLAIETLST